MTTEFENRLGATPSDQENEQDFAPIRTNRSVQSAPAQSQEVDLHERDEYDHRLLTHRADLDSLDNQINNLNRTIELEQIKVRESKAALDNSYRARARLLHLRTAMLTFVLELESRGE